MTHSPNSRGTILYTGGFELPDRNAAAQRVTANAKIFAKLGYRVILLGVTRSAFGSSREARRSAVGVDGISCYETPYPRSGKEWLHRITSAAAVAQILNDESVTDLAGIICYNYPAVAQARIVAIAHSHGAWAAADCTEWYAPSRVRGIASAIRNLDIPLRMHLVNRRMDALVTTSPFISDFYRREGQPIVEIPTLMDPPPIDRESLTVNRVDGVTQLFFAGSGFDPELVRNSTDGLKDRLDWVFEALDGVHRAGGRFHLNLYGLDQGEYLALFPGHDALLARLDGCFEFHGRRPREELLAKLTKSHFSIFFRARTRTTLAGFPGKFSESIAFGTPVLTNPMPSVASFIRERQSGFAVNPHDREATSKHLADIFAMSDEAIFSMKTWCAQSHLFDFNSYVKKVSEWIATIRR